MTFILRTLGTSALIVLLSQSSAWAQATSGQTPGTTLDRLEASVNSSLILSSDVQGFKKSVPLRSQLDPLFAGTSIAAKGAGASNAEIVDFLVSERLILQQFPVSDAEVEQEINSIQANNRIDRASLVSALKDQGFRFQEYFDLIRISAAKRNLIDREIRTKVSVSEDDIKNYYFNQYSKSAGGQFSYTVKIITVSQESFKTSAAAKESAQKAQAALKGGESFEEVAKRVSDHPSASAGGELGTLTEDQMAPMIRDAVKKLQIGQTSDLIAAQGGNFVILKLADKKSDNESRYNAAKEEIRNLLYASDYQHQFTLWLERQRQTAFIHRTGEPTVASLPAVK